MISERSIDGTLPLAVGPAPVDPAVDPGFPPIGTSSSSPSVKSTLVKGESPLNRSAMTESGSGSPSITSALRKRSILAGSQGSRATRSSAITRASLPRPALRYASASCACAEYIVASRPPSTQTSTSFIRAGMCPDTLVVYSCRADAAAGQSLSATAASVATSIHWNPASASCSTRRQPSSTSSSRRVGSRTRMRDAISRPSSRLPVRSSISDRFNSSSGSFVSAGTKLRARSRSPRPM